VTKHSVQLYVVWLTYLLILLNCNFERHFHYHYY